MQQSGGLLLATARRSETSIFATGDDANESPAVHQKRKDAFWRLSFFICRRFESLNHNMPVASFLPNVFDFFSMSCYHYINVKVV